MAVKTFQLQHMPPEMPVHVALYKDVDNTAALKKELLAGNADFEYAFIDAATIVSTVHVLAAVHRALNDHLQGRQKSKNVHSEIVYSLNPNNNITESFRRFGISESTTSLVAVKVSMTPSITRESVEHHLSSVIQGTPMEFSDESIASLTDLARVRKIYKLGDLAPAKGSASIGEFTPAPNRTSNDQRLALSEIERVILGAMALRGAT